MKALEDIIRNPYVLEFIGLNSNDDFYESDLEEALIMHFQKFLLEFGRGFFVARQKRITGKGRQFRLDLVFIIVFLNAIVNRLKNWKFDISGFRVDADVCTLLRT